MSNKLIVSPSPHVYGNHSVKGLMYGVIIALIPTLFVSIYYFGLGAIVVTLAAVISSVGFEYLISKFILKREPSITDGSAMITGLLLAFNVPSNLPVWIIVIGAFVAVGVGKMSFGGLGNNIFNPALVGRVFLLISFPVQMTSWPVPSPITEGFLGYIDVETGATALGILQNEGVEALKLTPNSYLQYFIGNMGGSFGEVAGIALIIGFIYMLWKKIITWHIPVVMVASAAAVSGLLWLIDPTKYADPLFHILTGGLLLGAIFMATDYVSTPMNVKGMVIYAAAIGFLTIIIRVFGSFPEGVSFAILIMNAFVPLFNNWFKPKRFGEVVKDKKGNN